MGARQAVFRDELRVLPAQTDAAVGGRRAEAPQAFPVDAVLVLPVVGDGVEQHLAGQPGGIAHKEAADLVPGPTVGALLVLREDVIAHRRPVQLLSRGAEHLAHDVHRGRVVDGDDLVIDVHFDVVFRAFLRHRRRQGRKQRQRDQRRRQYPAKKSTSLQAHRFHLHIPCNPKPPQHLAPPRVTLPHLLCIIPYFIHMIVEISWHLYHIFVINR